MVTGPEHCYTFINARFAKLMGVQSIAKALGLSALDRFPGPERQRAGDLLDRVYQTGEPYLGVETRCQFFHDTSRRIEERIFNTVCQPICNAYGEVSGIMIETEDVTEMVLARAVRENREQLLFRQWAELEAIYRACPAAMMLVDARDFRILRVNEKQAELLGRGVVELLGRSLLEVAREPAELKKMLQQVLRGEPVSEHIVKGGQPHSSAAVARYWMKSCAPTLSASGKVESIILVGLEISEATRAELEPATLELEVMA
jgi:PAS domain S-box-containing protein